MSKHEKLLNKFRKNPKNFTWNELVLLLEGLGYRQSMGGRTGGSRRKFIHSLAPRIFLHQPHDEEKLKPYIIREVRNKLEEGGLL